jgi:hypothetical protein
LIIRTFIFGIIIYLYKIFYKRWGNCIF